MEFDIGREQICCYKQTECRVCVCVCLLFNIKDHLLLGLKSGSNMKQTCQILHILMKIIRMTGKKHV